MYFLGIEGSANKLAIGIINEKGDIIVNLRKTYIAPTGSGFMPRETSMHHRKYIIEEIQKGLKAAKITIKQVTCIVYTKGPGMGGCLIVGAVVARVLSQLHGIPIIGVNHCVGHIEMGRLICKCKDPVVLYVSGGNTQIISYSKMRKKYLIYGETIDIAIGNCLDRFARLANISNDPNPGYNIEKIARKSDKKNFIEVPYIVKGMDVSFSGVLSWIEKFCIPKLKQGKIKVEDLCFSLQETLFAMLIETTERLLSLLKKNEVLIVGGVGCNKRLQEMMKDMLKDRNGFMYGMDQRYCIDNGCMIAYAGLLEFPFVMNKKENREEILAKLVKQSSITQRFRTDQVSAVWRQHEGNEGKVKTEKKKA